ncbi:MAG: hypothetical protein ACRBBW_04035 [Cellvibrionaceae bacterium]
MKQLWCAVLTVLVVQSAFAEECEEAVDMADSLDFHKMHVECNEDPVVLYDPKSKSSFFNKKPQAVDTYGEKSGDSAAASDSSSLETSAVLTSSQSAVNVSAESPASQTADNAGVIFNIREPFTLTGGPQSALNGLFGQMANYCPAGWAKLKEWSVPNQDGYYLHYQFQCAEQ